MTNDKVDGVCRGKGRREMLRLLGTAERQER
jgi:hypothetical protein